MNGFAHSFSLEEPIMFNTVETRIWRKGLCHGCGTCAGCCPNDAIEMEKIGGVFAPIVNFSRCNGCKLCVEACPAIADFSNLNHFVFGQLPDEISIGNYINCYVGYSTDPQVRWNSASGGLITTLLIFALKSGMIDGAIATKMKKEEPLNPEVTVARTEAEIIEASRSKYCPTCVDVELKKILKTDGRYALVGLPCHIQGVRQAATVLKKLNARIYLHMGIFCLHNITFKGTDLLLEKAGVRETDVRKLDYRGEGWPGRISITLKNGEKKSFSYPLIWSALFGSFFFTPFHCTLCHDMTSELADISFGDAWLPEFKMDKKGISMVITRTERGERLLRKAEHEGKIKIQKISIEKVIEAHRLGISFKKRNLAARIKLLNLMRNDGAGVSNLQLLRPNTADYILAPLPYINMWISSSRHLLRFLRYAPIPLLKKYTSIFNSIRTLAA